MNLQPLNEIFFFIIEINHCRGKFIISNLLFGSLIQPFASKHLHAIFSTEKQNVEKSQMHVSLETSARTDGSARDSNFGNLNV